MLFLRRLASLAMFLAVSLSGPDMRAQRPDFSKVREDLIARMAATGTPAMAVAVARDREILWQQGFGVIDTSGTAATADTLFYAASVTKAVTATGLMVLQERGRLNLDRPANSYLKDAKLTSRQWNSSEATVRRLATHTAGLTTYDGGPDLPAVEIVRRYGIVFWRPGQRFDYSNLGFGVLGQIIANVSGRSFQSFVHDDVLRPLGMQTTWAGATPPSPLVARRFSSLTRAFSPALSEPTLPGASVMYSSAHELALFGLFHLQSRHSAVLSDAGIRALQEPAENTRQSLAWSIDENRHGYRTLLAQGGTLDSQAWLLLIPAEKIVVVVLANYGSAPAQEAIDQILSILLPAYRETRLKASVPPTLPTISVPTEVVGRWSGKIRTYRGDVRLTVVVDASGRMDGQLGTEGIKPLTSARFVERGLIGRVRGDLGIDYPSDTPYEVRLELYRHGRKLTGAAVTYALDGYYGPRLPFWVELEATRTR